MRFFGILLLTAIFTQGSSFASEPASIVEPELYPPTIPLPRSENLAKTLAGFPPETLTGLKNVRAVIIDIPLAKLDFPFMRNWTPAQVYRFFEYYGGVVSTAQARQTAVNTEILTDGSSRPAHRSAEYRRSVVLKIEYGGAVYFMEAKNVGVAPGVTPTRAPKENGLGTLAESIREDQFEHAVRAALEHERREGRLHLAGMGGTVPGYGVLDAGYSIIHPDGTTSRAGIYLRRATLRPLLRYQRGMRGQSSQWLRQDQKIKILKELAKFGFFTGWSGNLQGFMQDEKAYLIDLGHWIAWQGLVPEAQQSVDPHLAVDFNTWGWEEWYRPPTRDQVGWRTDDLWSTSKYDRPARYAGDLANVIEDPQAQSWVAQHYNVMLGPFLRKLNVGQPSGCEDELKAP